MVERKYIMRDIERAVCLRFKLTPERLRGAERQRKVMRPRQIAMYLARELTGASLPQIGRHFARDHTTVLHAVKKIAAMAQEGGRMPTYLSEIRAILEKLTPVKEVIAQSVATQTRSQPVEPTLSQPVPSHSVPVILPLCAKRMEGGEAGAQASRTPVAGSRASEGRRG